MNKPTPEQVRSARQEAGLTQAASAELLYVSLRCFQDWERGINQMPAAMFELYKIKTEAK